MSDFWNRLTVVFIVHNSVSVLPDVIKSLEGAKNLIIIDNASTDGFADLGCAPNE